MTVTDGGRRLTASTSGPRPLLTFRASAFIVVAILLAGCGGTGTSTTASSGGGASQSTTADLAYVKSELDKYSGNPEFVAPGPAFDAKKLVGKHIFSIPQLSTIPFLQTIENSMEAVAKQLDIKFTKYPTQGSQDQWIRGFQLAISQHADAIAIDAMNPTVVQPYIAQAKDAGIPVVSEQYLDVTQLSQGLPELAASRADNFTLAGKLMADWIIWDTKGNADVLIEANKEQLATQAIISSIENEFKTYCGSSCKLTYLDISAVDWATKITPATQAALVRDPNINYVLPAWDAMVTGVAAAITASGKEGKVHVATFNGTPFALKMIQDGDIVSMDLGENLEWMAYANLDQTMRAMLGLAPVSDHHLGFRVFTKDNVDEAGVPPEVDKGYGETYKAGYLSLWGIAP